MVHIVLHTNMDYNYCHLCSLLKKAERNIEIINKYLNIHYAEKEYKYYHSLIYIFQSKFQNFEIEKPTLYIRGVLIQIFHICVCYISEKYCEEWYNKCEKSKQSFGSELMFG